METKLFVEQNIEILAIGAQPRDVEIGVGGILLKMAHRGYNTVICDLSNGELTLDATYEEISEMSEKAAKILHVFDRITLNCQDIHLITHSDQIQCLAESLCTYRPNIILAPYAEDWNPNSFIAHKIVQKAIHLAGLNKQMKTHQPFVPEWIFYYTLNKPVLPQLVVNITSTFESKLEAIKSYQSKSLPLLPSTPLLSTLYKDILFFIESRSRHFGSLIQSRFGEGLMVDRPISVEDLCEFINL